MTNEQTKPPPIFELLEIWINPVGNIIRLQKPHEEADDYEYFFRVIQFSIYEELQAELNLRAAIEARRGDELQAELTQLQKLYAFASGDGWNELPKLRLDYADLQAKLERTEKALDKLKEQRDSWIAIAHGPMISDRRLALLNANKELDAILEESK